jgi:hypothetical protein
VLIWLVLACTNPELSDLQRALDAYAAGQVALVQGDPNAAAKSFARAAAADKERAAPIAWQAWAEDKAGRTEAALATLNAGLARFPADPYLRYNRAAIRARTGQLALAGSDLRWLYANAHVEPVEVADDGDFVRLGTDPELRALLPAVQVSAVVTGEPGSVVLGERFTLELDLVGRSGAAVSMQDLGEPTGLLRHTRTIEDVLPAERLWTRRRIRVEYRAVAAGQAKIGPWLISAAGTSVLTDRLPFEVVALPGRDARQPPQEATAVVIPSSWAGWQEPPWIGTVDGQRLAVVGPMHKVRPADARADGVQLELREAGQVRWTTVPLGPGVPVDIVERGGVVLRDPSAPD